MPVHSPEASSSWCRLGAATLFRSRPLPPSRELRGRRHGDRRPGDDQELEENPVLI